ncbi:hypothetical protein SE15_07850 [Thermanaerothrix daxensis]|uniref:Uncharacterized protein n=1 Tax=Thermanaerothrix daxensis TaxID=869279 RepID=A0A0P6Y212_9CHLR|nr:hypothetical protein [Thermanaerothrix daxensis]KPL83164.1 hypothetical protein SE15_07850 [Thermanaerothrix daxensis]
MNPRRVSSENPGPTGYRHWFDMPRTIPGRWDMSAYLNPPHPLNSMADMNGTAFEQSFTSSVDAYDDPKDAV